MSDILSLSESFANTLRAGGITVVTCLNCASAELALDAEVYSIQVSDPDRVASFDVVALRKLIDERATNPLRGVDQPRTIQPGTTEYLWLMWWLGNRSQPNLRHLDHIPAERLDEPGVLVWVFTNEWTTPDGKPAPMPILVDGTHRLLKRVMTGLPVQVYDASEDERDAVLTWRDGIDRELWPDAPKGRSGHDQH